MAYAICHLLVLGSACFNPLLYGWLNDNFRREFIKALCCCSKSRPGATATGATSVAGTRLNGARSVAVPSAAATRPPRRCKRGPTTQMNNDCSIELAPRKRYSAQDDELANDQEQFASLVS